MTRFLPRVGAAALLAPLLLPSCIIVHRRDTCRAVVEEDGGARVARRVAIVSPPARCVVPGRVVIVRR